MFGGLVGLPRLRCVALWMRGHPVGLRSHDVDQVLLAGQPAATPVCRVVAQDVEHRAALGGAPEG